MFAARVLITGRTVIVIVIDVVVDLRVYSFCLLTRRWRSLESHVVLGKPDSRRDRSGTRDVEAYRGSLWRLGRSQSGHERQDRGRPGMYDCSYSFYVTVCRRSLTSLYLPKHKRAPAGVGSVTIPRRSVWKWPRVPTRTRYKRRRGSFLCSELMCGNMPT